MLDELKCSHLVCKLCIYKLINRICPLCRAPLGDENSQVVSSETDEFISTEISRFDTKRPFRRARRRRTREHNREVEDIITQIFSIPLHVSFADLELIEQTTSVPYCRIQLKTNAPNLFSGRGRRRRRRRRFSYRVSMGRRRK